MAPNDLVALKANFERWRETRGVGLTGINLFNYYCIENFLKPYPVNDKEIRDGAVDATLDGGVDGFYFFANRKYVFEDNILDPDVDYNIDLILFQCKEGSGFSPVEVGKVIFFLKDLLDQSRQESDYTNVYHKKLKALMKSFKNHYAQIAGTVLSLKIRFLYITKLDAAVPESGSDVDAKSDLLQKEIRIHFPKSLVEIEYINAEKLMNQAKIRKLQSKNLVYSSQTIQSDEGWIGLVDLKSLFEFLQDEHGLFHEDMLEENVRGYQMKTNVNAGIAKTLREPDQSAEFWVLNNGITILAEQLSPAGMKSIIIKDPQIVNGLQTSRNIFDYYKSMDGGNNEDNRRVLVRVIETKDNSIRDQIIRATNSQNKMPPEALRVTDPIHSKIEEVFHQYGLFYDRRKGYYKDQGQPASKIVSVREVLQSTLAISLRRPNDARARPADYLKDDLKYIEIFASDKLQISTYLRCTEIVRRIDEHVLKNNEWSEHNLNLLFYVALCATARLLNNAHVPAQLVNAINLSDFTAPLLDACYEEVFDVYKQCGGDDKAAKGPDMTSKLVELLEKSIHGVQ